jgi:putative membrane protein
MAIAELQPALPSVDALAGLATSNGLAVERTVLAAERTLMAWIRTGLAMLSFGFTIYKFLLYVRQSLSTAAFRAQGPRRFGISLIFLGTLSMIFGLVEYHGLMRGIDASHHRKPRRLVFVIGAASACLGLFLLVTILLHLEVF